MEKKLREIELNIENVLSNYSICIKYEVDGLLIDALNRLDDFTRNPDRKELLGVIYSLVDEATWNFPCMSEYQHDTMFVCDYLETVKWLLEELMEVDKDAARL